MRRLLFALISCGMVVPAAGAAPGVRLAIRDGSVWLAADRATAGEILAEWARVGQTRIINGERVPGGPMTLELNGVPEQQALEIVLRSASGFLALARTIARADALSPSMTSRFERILVLPASATQPSPGAPAATGPVAAGPAPVAAGSVNVQPPAPRVPQMPPGATSGASAPQRIIGPDGLPLPDDQEDAPRPLGAVPPGFAPPPAQAVPVTSGANPATPGANPANPGTPGTNPAAPRAVPISPAGVPVPGMIVPAPQQPSVAPPVRRRPGDPR